MLPETSSTLAAQLAREGFKFVSSFRMDAKGTGRLWEGPCAKKQGLVVSLHWEPSAVEGLYRG